ncbi:hypothetical protein [Neokomagataea thailandica]|uniref:Anti-sigma factor NepR domain-containing protein n=1 Tax=Neokomagataea tanensis NBRC 106556 TaxID=1223519 RepID=A0ABQ0QK70_9PROT|nr:MULTISPECIES: hypothetical protein [Neokomagataea]GBR47739.1 hypothetical protein AA106556_1559 [Neokomagataea tanensis NBRC 106556]
MNGSKKHNQSPKAPDQEARTMRDETPFGIWLSRGLHKLFDDIAHEPIPEYLLKLIEDDRSR